MLLAPYINEFYDNIKKKDFENILFILIILFSVLPTFFYYGITGDRGKGLVNLYLSYSIGRYIQKYGFIKIKQIRLVLLTATILLSSFVLNLITSLIYGKGLFTPFAGDCSIFTLSLAIFVFAIFLNLNIRNVVMSKFASFVFPIYLNEEAVRMFLNQFINIFSYLHSILFYAIFIVYVIVVMTICYIIEKMRRKASSERLRRRLECIGYHIYCSFFKIKYLIKGEENIYEEKKIK